LEWVLGQSERSKTGGNIDDSREHRSHISCLATPVRCAEKHDPIQAWAELWFKNGRVDDGLECLLVSATSRITSEKLFDQRYLLGNNASETVTYKHDRPLVILSHCKPESRLPITDKMLDLLQCRSQSAQAVFGRCSSEYRGVFRRKHRRGIHTSRRAILVN
jgi:hypothetical protein